MKKLSWAGAAMIVAGFAVTSVVLKGLPWSLTVNVTPSVPLGFYMLYETGPNFKYELGQLVSFSYSAPAWTASRPHYPKNGSTFSKYIGASSGEYLFTEASTVYACKTSYLDTEFCRNLGKLRKADSKGLPLPQNLWDGYKIPENYVFMTATRVNASYDSRQYGLVHKAALLGHLVPIVTW